MMTSGVRRVALTTHITTSIGWLGAVVAFLALALAGLASGDSQAVRAAYISMHVITWFVIVPFCVASFLTGVVEGVGTPWGLFRHYWVVVKLLLTTCATFLLLLHTRPIDQVVALAQRAILTGADVRPLRLQLVGDASAALFVLLMTTMLSVYKPWGMTPYGLRTLSETAPQWRASARGPARSPGQLLVVAIIAFVVLIILLHAAGMGMHGH
jgi:hypothetical protein